MGRHHSIFGDIKKAFNDAGHDIKHSPIINSVIHDTKDAGKAVINTVSDPQFQKDFGTGFKMGANLAMDTVVPVMLPEVGLAMDAVSSAPSLLSSVSSSVGNSISSVSSIGSAISNPLGSIMPYLPIVGGVVGLLVLYKLMKKK